MRRAILDLDADRPKRARSDADEAVTALLHEPLATIPKGEHVMLHMDAMDEGTVGGAGRNARRKVLQKVLKATSGTDKVSVVMTTRPDANTVRAVRGAMGVQRIADAGHRSRRRRCAMAAEKKTAAGMSFTGATCALRSTSMPPNRLPSLFQMQTPWQVPRRNAVCSSRSRQHRSRSPKRTSKTSDSSPPSTVSQATRSPLNAAGTCSRRCTGRC